MLDLRRSLLGSVLASSRLERVHHYDSDKIDDPGLSYAELWRVRPRAS